MRRSTESDNIPKNKKKSRKNSEDHSQLKHAPEDEMLVLVEPGLNPSVVITPSTETEHKSIEPPLLPQHS